MNEEEEEVEVEVGLMVVNGERGAATRQATAGSTFV
jgi:hypothetical protein